MLSQIAIFRVYSKVFWYGLKYCSHIIFDIVWSGKRGFSYLGFICNHLDLFDNTPFRNKDLFNDLHIFFIWVMRKGGFTNYEIIGAYCE